MKIFGAFALMLGLLPCGGAAVNHDGPLMISSSLVSQLLAEARTNSPALRAASARTRAAQLGAEAVRTWEDPTLMFGGSVFSARGFDAAEEGDLAYGVEQKLPLWGKPALNRRAADAETSMRQADADYRLRQLRRDIEKELLTAALAEKVVEVGEQDLAWLETTIKTVETKYGNGQAVLADTLQMENDVAERNDRLRTERHLRAHEYLNLNRLLNRAVDSPWPHLQLPPPGPAIPFSAKLLASALASEPKLKVMEQEIKQAAAAAELTRRNRLPEVSLGVETRQYSGDGGLREGDFTLRFSLPWFNRDKYRKDYGRDKERQRSAEQDREEQVWMVREQLHHLTVEIEASRREALLYQGELTSRAGQVLNTRLTDWENGHGTLRDVFDARRDLLDKELMSSRAAATENEMRAELVLWSGLETTDALAPLASEPSLMLNHDE